VLAPVRYPVVVGVIAFGLLNPDPVYAPTFQTTPEDRPSVLETAGETGLAIAVGAIGIKVGAARGGTRVTGDALKAARQEFNATKSKFWKQEATANVHAYSPEQIAEMARGNAPLGADGYRMELHHKTPLAEGGTNSFDNLSPLTRTDHRLGPSYKVNHPNLP
jgi:hypothetical protein